MVSLEAILENHLTKVVRVDRDHVVADRRWRTTPADARDGDVIGHIRGRLRGRDALRNPHQRIVAISICDRLV